MILIVGSNYISNRLATKLQTDYIIFDKNKKYGNKFYRGNPIKVNGLYKVTQKYKIDCIIYLFDGKEDTSRCYNNNVKGLINVLDVMKTREIPKIIFGSYFDIKNKNVYSYTKKICEIMILHYAMTYGIDFTNIRLPKKIKKNINSIINNILKAINSNSCDIISI